LFTYPFHKGPLFSSAEIGPEILSDALSVNFNFNSTSSVSGMLASGQSNEMDGLHDAQMLFLMTIFQTMVQKQGLNVEF